MVGLLGYLAAGAAESIGKGIADEGKAMREMRLKELEGNSVLERQKALVDYRVSKSGDLVTGEDGNTYINRGGSLERMTGPDGSPMNLAGGKSASASSTVGKINSDYEAGFIDRATRDALIAKATQSDGMEFGTNPDGSTYFRQGAGVGSRKPLTEGQSKDAVYATRAQGALTDIDQYGDALTGAADNAVSAVPGVGNAMVSKEFQLAQNAGNEFLQAILRKDTGAAITTQEMEEYGKTYLPAFGDKPETLERKKVARRRALEALKAGMPPDAILAQERALENTDAATGKDKGMGMESARPRDGGIPKPTSKAEFDALPSGATFEAPDGTIRIKP